MFALVAFVPVKSSVMFKDDKKEAVALRQPLFSFEVESLMFDVDDFKFKAIASNIIHQTSNIKEKGASHDGRSLRATVPFLVARGSWLIRLATCDPLPANCELRPANCGLRTANCGLRPANCGLRPAGRHLGGPTHICISPGGPPGLRCRCSGGCSWEHWPFR